MLHPRTVLKTVDDAVGVGVFATHAIPAGTITWVRDPLDRVLTREEVEALHPLQRAVVDVYAWEEEGRHILCWDHGRFVNHACDATCFGIGLSFDVAVRDIAAGEQLTNDDRALGLDQSFSCRCGSPACGGRVRPEDAPRLRPGWLALQAAALARPPHVEPPRAPWITQHGRLDAVVPVGDVRTRPRAV